MKLKIKTQKLTRDQQKNILGSLNTIGCSGCCLWDTKNGTTTCIGYYPPNGDCRCFV